MRPDWVSQDTVQDNLQLSLTCNKTASQETALRTLAS